MIRGSHYRLLLAVVVFGMAFFGLAGFAPVVYADEKPDGEDTGKIPDGKADNSPQITAAATFSPTFHLEGVSLASAAWGDYDKDGDLDVAYMGCTSAQCTTATLKVFRRVPTGFERVLNSGAGRLEGSVNWGDYDGDGDLDLLVAGQGGEFIFRNDNGSFVSSGIALPQLTASSDAAWGDYDNDGDLDILLNGNSGQFGSSRILRNDGAVFTDIQAALPETRDGSVSWADFDVDGDLDVFIIGRGAFLYRNDGNDTFTFFQGGFSGTQFNDEDWGDFDNDGDPDLALCGFTGGTPQTACNIYRNDRTELVKLNAGLQGTQQGSVDWGDYDNDGRLDLLISGNGGGLVGAVGVIYRNTGSGFVDSGIAMSELNFGQLAFGDFDGDHRLDIFAVGNGIAVVWKGAGGTANTRPAAPRNLQFSVSPTGALATFSWGAASDSQTPAGGLTYNLRVGTTPGGQDVMPAHAILSSGFRTVPAAGNTGNRRQWTLQLDPGKTYYWSVQTVDSALEGSGFVAEQSLDTGLVNSGVALPGVSNGGAEWGDYDRDGDLDVLLHGLSGGQRIARIYRNTNGVFADINAGIAGAQFSDAAWGDFDNDGDLDFVLCGSTDGSATNASSTVFKNTNGVFAKAGSVTGMFHCALALADFDRDGDLDILLAGLKSSSARDTLLFRNNGNFAFEALSDSFVSVSDGAVAWADFDGDDDMDALVVGDSGGIGQSRIYRNNNGSFADIGANLPGLMRADALWADFNNDGSPDLALSGDTLTGPLTLIYRNTGSGGFQLLDPGLPGLENAALAVGDFDNDADLDLAQSGTTDGASSGNSTLIYRTVAGGEVFNIVPVGAPNVSGGSLAWGDYDSDGKLDLLLTGSGKTALLRNTNQKANHIPTAPANPNQTTFAEPPGAQLTWSTSTDADGGINGLTYNIRIGTTPGGFDVVSPLSNPASGKRHVAAFGGVGHNFSWTISGLKRGITYYWAVQGVDNAYAGSPWSAERTFIVPEFVQAPVSLLGVTNGQAAWGDFNNDGKLDVASTGAFGNDLDAPASAVARGVGNGTFSAVANLPGILFGALAWGDYDGDGDLDLALTGNDTKSLVRTIILRNDGNNVFADVNAGLPGVEDGDLDWGDYDNDGDLDLLLTGSRVARLFRNDDGVLNDANAGFKGVSNSAAAWADIDNDRDLDVVIAGGIGDSALTRIYRNDGGTFSIRNVTLPNVTQAAVAWGDFDRDGDPDLLISGDQDGLPITKLFRNNQNGGFAEVSNPGLPAVENGDLGWGDYDNDGDLDVLINGVDINNAAILRVYRNSNGVFADANAALTPLRRGSAAFGDADNDGRLDILASGQDDSSTARTLVFLNRSALPPNTKPSAPVALTFSLVPTGTQAVININAASDTQTLSRTLTYNLRVGTTSGGGDVVPPMALANGTRLLPARGNMGHQRGYVLKNLTPGQTYFVSVQAIDDAYAGGPFIAEKSFVAPQPPNQPPNNGVNIPASGASVINSIQRFVTTCSDPNGWRNINTLEFKLVRDTPYGERVVLRAEFDEGRRVFRLYDPFTDTWSEGQPGSSTVLQSEYADLRLAETGFAGHGPTDPTVDLTWGVVFKEAAIGSNYRQVLTIRDDGGLVSGPNTVGDWRVDWAGNPAPVFSDVNPGDFFYLPVHYLNSTSRNVISGYGDGTFKPYNNTTRAQLAKIVILAAGVPLDGGSTPRFSDVQPDNTFFAFVQAAAAHNIVGGYADGAFRPYANVTRGQLAKVITLALGWTLANPPAASFADVPLGSPFFNFVETAVAHGVISGYDTDHGREFRPGNNATRGQISKIVYEAVTQ